MPASARARRRQAGESTRTGRIEGSADRPAVGHDRERPGKTRERSRGQHGPGGTNPSTDGGWTRRCGPGMPGRGAGSSCRLPPLRASCQIRPADRRARWRSSLRASLSSGPAGRSASVIPTWQIRGTAAYPARPVLRPPALPPAARRPATRRAGPRRAGSAGPWQAFGSEGGGCGPCPSRGDWHRVRGRGVFRADGPSRCPQALGAGAPGSRAASPDSPERISDSVGGKGSLCAASSVTSDPSRPSPS